jgi:RNA polymerase sigma-70 factor (ECF subfamily)
LQTPFRIPPARPLGTAVVRALHPQRAISDAELVSLLRSGVPEARALLFDRFASSIGRLVFSVLGPEPEAEDVIHEVFARTLESVGSLESPERLSSFIAGIAVFTSREWIRRRARWRWLRVFTDDIDAEAPRASEEVSEALRAAFDVLRQMPADERVTFGLRFIEGMEISEIAAVCDTSSSTVKRRLKDAQRHFTSRAQKKAALLPWLDRQEERARAHSDRVAARGHHPDDEQRLGDERGQGVEHALREEEASPWNET